VGLLIGIVLLWRQAGTLDYLELLEMTAAGTLPLGGLELITAGIYLGAMGKSAQFPLHIWLPDAMEGPTPVSALIHAATMVTAGVYLLTRTIWLFAETPDVLAAVGWIGAFTALLAATLACVQSDIKRVLAYSTVSQLGYMMAAMGAGFAGVGFHHLLTHGVFKALLFLAAGAVIHAVGTNDIFAMGGLARRMPQTAVVFVVGALSLAGIPFFGGFFSKEEILGAVWVGGHLAPFLMLAVAAFLTAFYMFRVVFITFFAGPAPGWTAAPVVLSHGHGGVPAHPSAHGMGAAPTGAVVVEGAALHGTSAAVHAAAAAHGAGTGAAHGAGTSSAHTAAHAAGSSHAHDAPWVMTLPLWVLALLSLAIGVTVIPHPAPDFDAPHVLEWIAVAISVAGILLAWLTYQRRAIDPDGLARPFSAIRSAAAERFWLDESFTAVYRWAVLGVSRVVGWIDRYLVDGVVNVLSAWTLTWGDRLRRLQTGLPQDYVYAVALGAILLIAWSQWAW
jgi:NADH-quinone oxidoreductase subunit L